MHRLKTRQSIPNADFFRLFHLVIILTNSEKNNIE